MNQETQKLRDSLDEIAKALKWIGKSLSAIRWRRLGMAGELFAAVEVAQHFNKPLPTPTLQKASEYLDLTPERVSDLVRELGIKTTGDDRVMSFDDFARLYRRKGDVRRQRAARARKLTGKQRRKKTAVRRKAREVV